MTMRWLANVPFPRRLWVKRVGLTAVPLLPVQPYERTSSDRPGMGFVRSPHVLWISWGNLWHDERLHSVHNTFRVQSVYFSRR
jgi:hypothetical protein